MRRVYKKQRPSEQSFTLFETMIALAIMSAMIIELMGLQGNTIYFGEYSSNVNRGAWLAKRVMSQVDYYWQTRPFADLKNEGREEVPFEDYPEFSYRLSIKEWKLPLIDLVTGGVGGDKKEDEDSDSTPAGAPPGVTSDLIKQQLGEEILKVARVDVSWAEGAKRNSIGLTYLLTNQKVLDEKIGTMKNDYDQIQKADRSKTAPTPTPTPGPGGSGSGSGSGTGTGTGTGSGTDPDSDLPPDDSTGGGEE